MKHEHILVIRFSALGDVAMTVPVVWALARQYPQVRITVLSRNSSRTFFEDLAPNVNFMAADFKNEYHGVKGLNALYRRLVAKQFTAVADLHNVLRSDYLRLRFNLGRYRVAHIDKHRRQRRELVNKKPYNLSEPMPTSFENYIDVFARLGYPIDPKNLCFRSIFDSHTEPLPPVPPKGNLNLVARAVGPKRSWEHWIGIAPFATYEGKIYPLNLMEQVIDGLVRKYPKSRIFLFGRGEQEEAVFSQWEEKWESCMYIGKHTENLYHYGLSQHAHGFAHGHASRQHLGSHPSQCRLPGMETVARQCHPAQRTGLSSVQHLWQETLSARRLCLHEQHPS